MTKRKAFKAPKKTEREPIEIKLGSEVVRCRPQIAGLDLLPIMAALDGERLVTAAGGAVSATLNFFNMVFLDDDAVIEKDDNGEEKVVKESSQFRAMTTLREEGYEMRDLIEIAMWLVEQYTENPTDSANSSSDGSTKSGSGSTDATSEEDWT